MRARQPPLRRARRATGLVFRRASRTSARRSSPAASPCATSTPTASPDVVASTARWPGSTAASSGSPSPRPSSSPPRPGRTSSPTPPPVTSTATATRTSPSPPTATCPCACSGTTGTLVEHGTLSTGGHHQSAVPSNLDGDGKLDLVILGYPLVNRVPSTYLIADNGEVPELWLGNGDFTFRRLVPRPGVLKQHWSFRRLGRRLPPRRPHGAVRRQRLRREGSSTSSREDGGVEERAEKVGLKNPGPGMSADLGDVDPRRDPRRLRQQHVQQGRHAHHGPRRRRPRYPGAGRQARARQFHVPRAGGRRLLGGRRGAQRAPRSCGASARSCPTSTTTGRLEVLVANGFISAPNRHDH